MCVFKHGRTFLSLREQVEEEQEGKAEAFRQISKLNAEIQQWKTRFEGEGLLKADELEDAKRRQQQRISELEEACKESIQELWVHAYLIACFSGCCPFKNRKLGQGDKCPSSFNPRLRLETNCPLILMMPRLTLNVLTLLISRHIMCLNTTSNFRQLERKQKGFDKIVDEWRYIEMTGLPLVD